MTDAPFTETDRAMLQHWVTNPSTQMFRTPSLDDAIAAALKEIDRLTAENLALWTERQARIFPEQLRQAEADIQRRKRDE